ncbi:ATP-dependent DNA helicase Q-like 3 [Papaver somniferum]|uniref:ATP-dependent DNA helicase Q-like 3 n=1 Tax=Papaver somniferum TaxID=3469 RepID=UPI000E705D32|nr:ATP-dependent DNA helicase Q-like 3 [Papaver somniferum]
MCYQMTTLSKSGIGLVVSSLIGKSSHGTKGKGIAVEYLSPTQTLEIRQKIFKDLSSEELSLRLHYVPPELIATTRDGKRMD